MTDTIPSSDASAETDLAYLKRMAAAGRGEPAPFLLLMAIFGLGYGLTALTFYVALIAELPLRPGQSLGPLFKTSGFMLLGSHLAFVGGLLWTAWRTFGPRPIALSRAASATWGAAFIGLIVVSLGIRLFARDQEPTDAVYAIYFVGPVLLVLWGSAWWVTAILTERRWLLGVAVGSFAASLGMAHAQNSGPMFLIGGLALLLLSFLPAVLLMRERRG